MSQALHHDTLSQPVSSPCQAHEQPHSGIHPVVTAAPSAKQPSIHETLMLHPRVVAAAAAATRDDDDDDQSPTVVKALSPGERKALGVRPVQPLSANDVVAATMCMYPSQRQPPRGPVVERTVPVAGYASAPRPEAMQNLPAFLRDPTAIAPVLAPPALPPVAAPEHDPDRLVIRVCGIIAFVASTATVVLLAVRFG